MKIKKLLSLVTALAMTAGLYVPMARAATEDVSLSWNAFKFNTATGVPGVINKGNNTDSIIAIDETVFVEGDGSLHIAPAPKANIYGDAPSDVNNALKAGDMISGTCWLKIVSGTPVLRFYNGATTFAQLGAATGNTQDGGWAEYSIVSVDPITADGIALKYDTDWNAMSEYYIDDVTLYATRGEDETPTEAPTEAPIAGQSEDATAAFNILQFEDASAFDATNSYGTFTITNENVNKGIGALSTSSNFSLWGGGVAANAPAGSTISGTVAFRLDQPMYDAATSIAGGATWFLFPSIKVVRASDKAVLAELTQADFNISEYTAETWITVNIPSTGETFSSEDAIEYTVARPQGGAKIMVDSITFTVSASASEPTPAATSKPSQQNQVVVPVIDEYIGSVMNGDFEVGDDRVGNQYWGTWTTDGEDGLTLITNPSSTQAQTAVSGKKIIQVNSNLRSAWNLFAFAQNEEETLPRLGDTAGGSFWLYVPANADLTKNIPFVTFGYQSSPDTDIATSAGYDRTKLVKGQWNEIPIMPIANASIQDVSKQAAIFIKADNIDTSVNYYIDKIRVGKITEGIFFSDVTALTKEIENSDETVDAKLVIQNSKSDTDINATAYVAAYDDGRLVGLGMNNITIPARGNTGVSITETQVSGINVKGIDRNALKIKALLFDSKMVPLAAVNNLYYATKKIDPQNANIEYIGRWRETGDSYTSSYIRPYLKTNFTGTSIAIDLGEPTSLQVTIDGKTSWYNTVNGRVVLAENLASKEHSIRIASVSYTEVLKVNGIYIDVDAQLRAPVLEDTHIEFIGDSITAWDNGYSWQVGEALGTEHSRVAWPGITLTDGIRYYTPNYNDGMEKAYFNTGVHGVQGVPDDISAWDFEASPYTPDIAVINLGTNDADLILWAVPSGQEAFANTYGAFIDNIRAKLPNTEIFVMRPVSMPHTEQLMPAVEAMLNEKMKSDSKLHYIDTTDWNVALNNDNIHPNAAGHTTITNNLCNILRPYVDNSAPQSPTAAPVAAPTAAPTSAPTTAPTAAPSGDEEILEAYDCWDNLKFENGGQKPANMDTYDPASSLTYTNSSELAYNGNGALKLNGNGYTSVWGTRVAGDGIPHSGDTVGGYFWIKLNSQTTKLPNVKMVKYDDHTVIYAKTKTMTASEISALPTGQWIKIDLESTGITYTDAATTGFVIETEAGVDCLIDDITFGRINKNSQSGGEVVNGLKKITPDNINIRYIGRWSGDSESFESGWVRPYIKLKFTGENLKMDLQEATNLQVMIDGQPVYGDFGSEYSTVNGTVTIASGLADTTHEARISTIDLYKRIKYSGFWVDEDSVLSQPTTYKTHIEFVGDSITSANDGYAWTAGEALGTEHTRISWPGLALTDTRGYTGFYPYYGMETAYSFVTLPGSQNTTAGVGTLWDFDKSQYEPDIFVINLGTNDAAQITGNTTAVAGFENSYKKLISDIREKYPDAEIFALRAVSIPNADVNSAVQSAVEAMEAVDSKVHYVDTSSWGVEISSDTIHPTMAGYNTMSAKLVELLRPYVTEGTEVVTPSSIPGTIEAAPYEAEDIEITPYGCFEALGFEAGQPQGSGIAGGDISFVQDIAHTGNGSMKINVPQNYFSSNWGNGADNGPLPSAGDMVSGSFWIYLLDTPTSLPVVKMVDAYNTQNVIYCQTDTNVDLSKLPLRTWIKINTISNGTAYNAQWPAYVIETQTGFNGYVDDIVFGKLAE